jgi:hypothetical protein
MKVTISLWNIEFLGGLINKLNSIIVLGLVFTITFGCKSSREIQMQNFKMSLPIESQSYNEELLHGQIADTKIEHLVRRTNKRAFVNRLKQNQLITL